MLDVAIEAARKGGQVAYSYFKNVPKVSYKADKSPVTKADIEAERTIRSFLSKKFPDHGIIGEELPPTNPKAKYKWVIDPIDGTRDYIRKIPFWATYVALLEKNRPIIGVVYLPVLNETITAQRGKGAYLNGKKTHVSSIKKIENSYISHGQIKRFENLKKIKQLENLCNKVRAARR